MAYKYNPLLKVGLDETGSAISALNVKGSVADVASLPGDASVGDVYLVTADAHFYVWDGAQWDDIGTLQGPAGADGKTILNGSGAPSAGLGEDGDFYLDTTATAIYGPKTAGAWGSPTSLIGPKGDKGDQGDPGADGIDGRTILNGTGAPSNALGADGDFYIDTAASDIYGPKTAGVWGSGTSLIGPPAEYVFIVACSDETSNLTAGTAKASFVIPFAGTLTAVEANVNTAPTGSSLVVDINEAGVSVLSTKLSIDTGETSSSTAAVPAVISDSALAAGSVISIDIDQIGSTIPAAGLKVTLYVTRS